MTEDLRYPIGKFAFPETITDGERAAFLTQIAEAPARLREAVAGLDDEQLATPYRPGAGRYGRSSTTSPTAT